MVQGHTVADGGWCLLPCAESASDATMREGFQFVWKCIANGLGGDAGSEGMAVNWKA